MNYFVTHCDINFLKYAERLFETLSFNSNNKIIFYAVDFDYISKYTNVIVKKIDSKNFLNTFSVDLDNFNALKAYNVFLKPYIAQKTLEDFSYNNFCYLDADCLAIKNCDEIFKKIDNIIDYPLLNKGCHDFMLIDGRGDPFTNGGFDLNLCLEADLMKKLKFDLKTRKQYLQTGVFLFNNKCINFINVWANLCSNKEIINDWLNIAPFHEETVINCLLWQKSNLLDVGQSLINLPYNTYDYSKSFDKIKEMIVCLENTKNEDYFIDTFCRIPSKDNIKHLCFYHGKISDNEYNYIKELMNNNYLLKIHSQSLGDTLAATPTLRKLYHSYNKKIDVISYHPELFKNNKYINKLYNFSDSINEKSYGEIFNIFLGVGGEKNKYGVEKKHNTIDIRQYHAIDLGFMLNESEMEYDYTPDDYIPINFLPDNYICLHVSNTWPSRTYSDHNWQTLIDLLNTINISVVLIGKNSYESGFYNIDKSTKKLNFKLGLDLTNKLSISQCWYVINKAEYFITMDSGLLHLAGTTDTNIIQLGSSINNKLRAPYRKNKQDYKYKYISGPCNIFCASDIKYGVKEWKTIQGIPPLINCLENKKSFECHPEPKLIFDYIKNNYNKTEVQKKFLFIAPHLSTGGSPKYLEWLIINKIKEGFKVKVIEWNLYSDSYTIQRDSIIKIIGQENFYSVGTYYEDDKIFYNKIDDIIKFINDYNPDYIHLNEFSENFAIKQFSDIFIKYLYNQDRKYKLIETSHSAKTNILEKINIPDELWLVSDYQYKIANKTNIKSILVEMELLKNIRPDREKTLKSLGLDPNKMHVLQVGLICKNKNQKFTFDVAKNFINSNVEFHFIGNTCYIDECDIDRNQSNCRIWGERSDVDVFMSCMDIFVMPSYEELNPIALKEALSWDMKCFINNIETIYEQYKNNVNINFIQNNNLFSYINSVKDNFTFKPELNFTFNNLEINNIICNFYPKPKIEILGNEKTLYNIKFIDKKTNKIYYETNINNNMWCECSICYFCDWKIIVTNISTNNQKIFNLELKNKNVKIINDSSSLGDSIAWMSAVDIFQKKHGCIIDYYTAKKNIFEKEYKNINFYNYSDNINKIYYAEYKIGCFDPQKKDLCVSDWRITNLQQIAYNILGLEGDKNRTRINVNNKFKLKFNKYICIATQSTSQSRYWNAENGWFEVINYLKNLGFQVVCVDKHLIFGTNDFINTCPSNIDYFAGDHNFDDIVDIINNCEFFIGLSSGLSWVSWALNKKIIKINGSVDANFEFYTPYNLYNTDVCHGCFNNLNHKFNSSDWAWCPENKNFECSKQITVESVIKMIDKLIQENNIEL